MFLHPGKSTALWSRDVVGVFDMENTTSSRTTRAFLAKAEARGEVKSAAEDLPRSFVLCAEEGEQTVWLSPYAPATLRKRGGLTSDD